MANPITVMHLFDDETIKDAYIYFYIAIEENEECERNKIIKLFNTNMLEYIKGELTIRDVQITPLINRAVRIIDVNKKLKS